jgi:hypothetical protein
VWATSAPPPKAPCQASAAHWQPWPPPHLGILDLTSSDTSSQVLRLPAAGPCRSSTSGPPSGLRTMTLHGCSGQGRRVGGRCGGTTRRRQAPARLAGAAGPLAGARATAHAPAKELPLSTRVAGAQPASLPAC